MSTNFLQFTGINLGKLVSDPGVAEAGDVYFNTTLNEIRRYDGSAWNTIPAGSFALTDLSNLTNPTNINQPLLPDTTLQYSLGSTTKRWTRAYIGGISLSSGNTRFLTDNGVMFDSSGNESVHFDNRRLTNSAGTSVLNWSGTDLNINSRKITNVSDPTNPQDVATKNYVDGIPSGANTALSNLISTSINQNLVSDSNNTRSLGENGNRWTTVYAGAVRLSDSSEIIDLNGGRLKISTGQTVVNWGAQLLNDSSLQQSINWGSRTLLDTSSAVVFDWSGANININTRKIVNVVDPTSAQEAATKNYVDTAIAGSSGANQALSNLSTTSINVDLLPSTNNTRVLGSNSLKWNTLYVNTLRYGTGSSNIDLNVGILYDQVGASALDLNAHKLANSANTVVFDFSGTNLDINTRKIINVVDPTSAQDVATKAYVDSVSSTGTFSDSIFRVYDNGNNTKQLAFEVSAISPSTTQTWTVPDVNLNFSTSTSGTFAINTLNNLGTTSINSDLLPSITDVKNIGSNTLKWNTIYTTTLRYSSSSANINLSLGELNDQVGAKTVDLNNHTLANSANTTVLNFNGTNLDINTRKIINVTDPTSAQDVATKNYVDLNSSRSISGTAGSPNAITAVGGITPLNARKQVIFVAGSGGAITITAVPAIATTNAIVGDEVILIGRSSSNLLTINNQTNSIELNGNITLGLQDVLTLVYDGTAYVEVSRNN